MLSFWQLSKDEKAFKLAGVLGFRGLNTIKCAKSAGV